MTQSFTMRGHQILSHFVHLLLLALHATSNTRKQMGLPFHPAAKQEMIDSWTAMSRRPRAVVEEQDRNCPELRLCSHFSLAAQQDRVRALSSRPKLSALEDRKCLPQVQMVETGPISLEIYLEKNHLLIISRCPHCQDHICSRLRPSCLPCSIAFFDASPYRIFWCKSIPHFHCVTLCSYIWNLFLLSCCISTGEMFLIWLQKETQKTQTQNNKPNLASQMNNSANHSNLDDLSWVLQ